MIDSYQTIDDCCPYCNEALGQEELDDAAQLAEQDDSSVSLVVPCESCGEILEIYVFVQTVAQVSINKV